MPDIGTDLYLAYEDGYEAGKKDATQEWISVKEKLPETGKNVLVCFQNGDMAVACVFDTDEDLTLWRAVTDEGWTCDCDTEPTHWMPLPEPPEEVNDGNP